MLTNLLEFGDYLQIKRNQSSLTLKKYSTFNIEFDIFGEYMMNVVEGFDFVRGFVDLH